MANRPIYAGSYNNRRRNRIKTVFIVIVLLHLVAGIYILVRPKHPREAEMASKPAIPASPAPAPTAKSALSEVVAPAYSPAGQAVVTDARAAINAGQLADARAMLSKLVSTRPDPEVIELLGQVNMQMLKSPLMMPGKEYYVIQPGDYLQKIAKTYSTTVSLIKAMNGLETDTIRAGDRLLVFNGNLSIQVSKSRNELDLLSNGTLFKRYRVGTGQFGKTPSVEFTLIDKIIEPPWTRPSDGRQIEYGDPENVLGTRWMALQSENHPELTGFGIHGTWERDSIGKQSSAGCIRMLNEDVEELFDLVPRKTSVVISE